MSAGSVKAARPANQQAGGGATPTPALHQIKVTANALKMVMVVSMNHIFRDPIHEAGPGSSPRVALHQIRVAPIPLVLAKAMIVQHHYLHSWPGGTKLAFGVFVGMRLLGAIILGVGPTNAHRMVAGAGPEDCLALTRLYLSDDLPKNSESKVLGIVLRNLKRHTNVRFLISYADPAQGHLGTIYQATNWLYTGLSEAMPLYDLGDGKARHSRSLAHAFGTHSVKYFKKHGIKVTKVPQSRKHRYVYFLNSSWRSRLIGQVLPYPKEKGGHEDR